MLDGRDADRFEGAGHVPAGAAHDSPRPLLANVLSKLVCALEDSRGVHLIEFVTEPRRHRLGVVRAPQLYDVTLLPMVCGQAHQSDVGNFPVKLK